LDGLATRERKGQKVILPIWLDLDITDVTQYSPILADRKATMAKEGMDKVISDIISVICE